MTMLLAWRTFLRDNHSRSPVSGLREAALSANLRFEAIVGLPKREVEPSVNAE
jgi:hypothetical protein